MSAQDTTNPLLQHVDEQTTTEYYKALLHSPGDSAGLEVRLDAGGDRGKGLFATKEFTVGDVILSERPLAGVQDIHSKLEVATCAHCFRAVGTVEQAFGGKICCLINELSEATEDDELRDIQDTVDKIQAAVDGKFLEGLLSNAVHLPLSDKVDMASEPVKCRGGCGEEYCCSSCEAAAWERYHCLLCPKGVEADATSSSSSSAAGEQAASSSNSGSSGASSSSKASKASKPVLHQLHGVRINRSKLGQFFDHADESNDIFRVAAQVIATTLVAADKLLQQAAADAAEDVEAKAAFSRAARAASAVGARTATWVLTAAAEGSPASKGAADAEAASPEGPSTSTTPAAVAADEAAEQQVSAAAFASATAAAKSGSKQQQVLVPAAPKHSAAAEPEQQQQQQPSQQQCQEALQAAFLPFAMGHKAPWWEVAAAAETAAAAAREVWDSEGGGGDSDDDVLDPQELAAQLKELSGKSLSLLAAGLQDDRFPQLFDLELYGSLVGMFELNNLALTIPAPVGRYKALLQYPEDSGIISPAEAAAALDEVTPLLEALGDAADAPAEGTGFFAVQSTINHSCAPNAAAECLASGEMIITALQDIEAGQEVLISYIEEEGADVQERQAMLQDYGFTCSCARCQAEQLASSLEEQQQL